MVTALGEQLDRLRGAKVVVTGGAGFIGSHLCEELVRLGAEVYSVDNYSAGKKRNIEHLLDSRNFHEVRCDVCDGDAMNDLISDTDTVFHNAASKKNICLLDPQKDLAVNAGGTLGLLQLALKHRVRKFVHASTGSVYGEPTIFPTTEDHPLRPVSYYGVSKLAGERYVDVFHRLYGLDTTILRYFHVYGPRQESNEFGGVVSIFLRKIQEGSDLTVFGDGTQMRSFTWVKDLVNANLRAAVIPAASGQAYNAASGIKITINDLASGLLRLAGSSNKVRHGDPLIGDIMYFDVSNKKIRDELSAVFETDFWGTMQKTLDEFVSYLSRARAEDQCVAS